ncbi:GntR family transcriptional regulator [Microcella sp.]|uniref:GntR family transcriptional regulator n=1 Tax=Microcella sp. TaxID=1913979 RepID=UPI003F71708B
MAMFQRDRGPGELDREAPTALHTQISDAIRAGIADGTWQVGLRMPSEPELAAELSVSRGTLRRALSTLIDEGLLTQTPGRGTFVSARPEPPSNEGELRGIAEDFALQGLRVTTRVLRSTVMLPSTTVGTALHVLADEPVVALRRVRSTDSVPIALLDNYVRADFAPGLEAVDLENETLFDALENRYGLRIGHARRRFAARAASTEVATHLSIAPGTPVLHLQQTTVLTDGRPVEYSDVWINSDEISVSTLLERAPRPEGTA